MSEPIFKSIQDLTDHSNIGDLTLYENGQPVLRVCAGWLDPLSTGRSDCKLVIAGCDNQSILDVLYEHSPRFSYKSVGAYRPIDFATSLPIERLAINGKDPDWYHLYIYAQPKPPEIIPEKLVNH